MSFAGEIPLRRTRRVRPDRFALPKFRRDEIQVLILWGFGRELGLGLAPGCANIFIIMRFSPLRGLACNYYSYTSILSSRSSNRCRCARRKHSKLRGGSTRNRDAWHRCGTDVASMRRRCGVDVASMSILSPSRSRQSASMSLFSDRRRSKCLTNRPQKRTMRNIGLVVSVVPF